MNAKRTGACALALCLLAMPLPASAYIGPGAGLSALGTFVAIVGAFVLLLAGFVWYPVKRLLRGRAATRAKPAQPSAARSEAAASSED
jgi:hypothetical protein